jgi:hypothetical protein
LRDRRWKLDVTRDQVSAQMAGNGESGAGAEAAAGGGQCSAMGGGKRPRNRHSDPWPCHEPGRAGGIGAVEPFEDVRPVLGGDAPAGIGDGDFDIGSGRLGAHVTCPPGGVCRSALESGPASTCVSRVPIGGQAGQFSRELGGELHATVFVAGAAGVDGRGHELVR